MRGTVSLVSKFGPPTSNFALGYLYSIGCQGLTVRVDEHDVYLQRCEVRVGYGDLYSWSM